MPSDSTPLDSPFLPEQPMHPEGAEFFAKVAAMLDGHPKDATLVEAAFTGWESLLEKIGADLYRIASMLIGEGEETIALLEKTVSTVDLPACANHIEASHNARLAMAADAIELLQQRSPSSLAAPAEGLEDSAPMTCIEDDDLSAAGLTPIEFEELLVGPDRHRLRDWLESLSTTLRVVFVLRAVAALSSAETAGLLAEHGGPNAESWTPDAVRSTFRQALCSLASQLIHASSPR